jgi:hypothetical protein
VGLTRCGDWKGVAGGRGRTAGGGEAVVPVAVFASFVRVCLFGEREVSDKSSFCPMFCVSDVDFER